MNTRGERLLSWFIRSDYFESWNSDNRSCGSAGIILSDPDRFDRIMEAAEGGAEGSTHAEVIQDWRDALSSFARDRANPIDRIEAAVTGAIDNCEGWHEANGTLNEEIG